MTRRNVGIGLVLSAVVLAVAAVVLWISGTDDAEADQLAEEYRAAIQGDSPDDVDADRTVPIALAAVAGVLVIAGTVVLVVPSPDS